VSNFAFFLTSLPICHSTCPGTYKCSTGFSGVVYGLLAVEVCLFYRSQRAWEVAGLVKHAFLLKTVFLAWEELSADSSVLKDKTDGTYHAGHLAGMLTGCFFVLAMHYSLRFQSLARSICGRWSLPFPFLDETSIAAAIAKEGNDISKGIMDGAREIIKRATKR
jgi:membrane associated rhomboid family serine protease